MGIPRREIEKVMKLKGHINGMGFLEDKKIILEKLGEEAVRKMEKNISEASGEDFSYSKFKSFTMYPLYFSVLTTLSLKYDFGFSNKELKEFGENGAKVSLLVKLFLRNFVSLKQVSEQAERIWRKYFDVGKLTVENFDEKERHMVIKITEFDIHPIYCIQIEGVIHQLLSYIIRSGNLKVEEVECTFRDGKSHKFKITW